MSEAAAVAIIATAVVITAVAVVARMSIAATPKATVAAVSVYGRPAEILAVTPPSVIEPTRLVNARVVVVCRPIVPVIIAAVTYDSIDATGNR